MAEPQAEGASEATSVCVDPGGRSDEMLLHATTPVAADGADASAHAGAHAATPAPRTVDEMQVRSAPRKAFIGGFRSTVTGIEYHHATSQTQRKPRPPRAHPIVDHAVQTAALHTRTQQTSREAASQAGVRRPGVIGLIDASDEAPTDRILFPAPYVTSEQFHKRRIGMAIVIQVHPRDPLPAPR